MKYSSSSPSLRPPAPAGLPARLQPHLHHRVFHDHAGIQPVFLRQAGMGKTQAAVLGLAQPRIAVIGAQRIAAGGDEIHHRVEIVAA